MVFRKLLLCGDIESDPGPEPLLLLLEPQKYQSNKLVRIKKFKRRLFSVKIISEFHLRKPQLSGKVQLLRWKQARQGLFVSCVKVYEKPWSCQEAAL